MDKLIVMITSLAAKVPMIQAVATAFRQLDSNAEIVGADINPGCIGRHFVGNFWEMPTDSELTLQDVLNFCRRTRVTHIIPSRDAELSFYARHRDALLTAGISVMVSEQGAIETCQDKYLFWQQLGNQFPIIDTSLEATLDEQRWVVKERFGSGSNQVLIDVDRDAALAFSSQLDSPIFQPCINGTEYSVDCYFSAAGKNLGYVVRSRDRVQNGESVITTSRHRPDIGELAVAVASAIGLYGHVLVQIIEGHQGNLHIVEINPRYGGASGLSLNLGLKSFYWFARETTGQCLAAQGLDSYPANKQLLKYKQERVVQADAD